MKYIVHLNGEEHAVDVDKDTPLLWVIRDVIGMTGTKYGCGIQKCGCCSVHLDGRLAKACQIPMAALGARKVTTIEAVGATAIGAKVQMAWQDLDVVQCGYCQSGQIMAASALLSRTPHPTDTDIDEGMKDNLCRCGTYGRIREAIKQAAIA